MIYPVKEVRITSPYGPRTFDKWHYGVDFGKETEEILAVEDGIVVVSKFNQGGYGNYIVIEHNNEYCSLYAHLSERHVNIGDVVKKGDTIGIMGNTPISRGLATHLHFEIRYIKYCNQFWDKTSKNGRNNVPLHCIDPIEFIEQSNYKHKPSDWAEKAWEKGIKKGVVDGTNPKSSATREQIVQMFDNLGLLD